MTKKFFFFLLVGAIMIAPSTLGADSLTLKLSYGWSTAGKILDSWQSTTNYYAITTNAPKTTLDDIDMGLELQYHFLSVFSVGAGVGVFSKAADGTIGVFHAPGQDASWYNSYSPEFKISTVPLWMSASVSIPVTSKWMINVSGGLDYYFMKLDLQSSGYESNPSPTETGWSFMENTFSGKSRTLGYHLGLGLEFTPADGVTVFAEVIYRKLEYENLQSVVSESFNLSQAQILSGSSIFFYAAGFFNDTIHGDIVYRVSKIDYSGPTLRVGLNIRIADFD